MNYIEVVHALQPKSDLMRYCSDIHFTVNGTLAPGQVSSLEVLHRQVNESVIFPPAEYSYEKIRKLEES